MPPEDKEKLNTIDKLKNKLFSKSYQTKIEYRDDLIHRKKIDIPSAWAKKDQISQKVGKFFLKTSVFQKFFMFSIGFFVLAMGYVSYQFFFGDNTVSNENIEISIFGNAFTAGGEELPLQVEIQNKNNTALELVDLVIEYPRGSTGGLSQETERLRESIGAIPAGGVHDENIRVILFGEQGSVRPIRLSVEYRLEGSNAIFRKEKIYEVSINSTPINLLVDAPSQVTPDQDITFNIKATLNATHSSPEMLLKLDYPIGFEFISADPEPSISNNVWSLGELLPGVEQNISIVGKMVDVFDGEEKTFHVSSGSQSRKDKSIIDVVFNSLSHTVTIERPFVEAKLFISGLYQREYAAESNRQIKGEIRWENNLDTPVNDLVIRAKLSGNALNRKTIASPQGFYNSSEDVIIWDKNSQPALRTIEPGEFGAVAFTVSPLSLFSPALGLLSDPSIKVDITVLGRQVGEGNILKEVKSSESKVIRIISDVGFFGKGLYYTGPFQNSGAIPPKVEKETTYTIVWSLTNTSNNISKTEVRAILPSWVNFKGNISPSGEDVIYNSSTKEVLWNVGSIKKGTGTSGPDREVAFQVSFIPSLSQLGESPILIGKAVLTGHDDFANDNLSASIGAIDIRIEADPNFPESGGKVVE